jgi:beta-lactamase regulating signal transducer with metallopeptidase domain
MAAMSEAVLLILILSVTGTIPALILFALKPLIRHRSPETLQYYLWMIVLLRLVRPFSLPVIGP